LQTYSLLRSVCLSHSQKHRINGAYQGSHDPVVVAGGIFMVNTIVANLYGSPNNSKIIPRAHSKLHIGKFQQTND